MKILVVIPALGDVYGGPSQCVLELAQALGQQGCDIDLVTTNANGHQKLDVPLQEWLTKQNYRVQYFPYWGLADYKFSQSLSRWLFKHIKDYDLIQINAIFSISNLPAYWACQRYQVPYVVIPHGMLEPWALSYKAWKKRFYFTLLEKPALQQASALQMLAPLEAEQICSLLLKAPIFIAPNGINHQVLEVSADPELFYQQFPQTRNKTLILFLGRIDPKKGLDLLANAFSQIYARFPDTHLVIAGPDNIGFMSIAQGYFVQANCLEAVTFTGMLIGSPKYAALAAASLYVAPSYSEGFSLSILEGMAFGLPCVITKACNFPEAATAQAAYVVDIDANEIAQAMGQCLQEPQQAKAMGERARQLIFQDYTWQKISAKLTLIYRSLLQDNSPTALPEVR